MGLNVESFEAKFCKAQSGMGLHNPRWEISIKGMRMHLKMISKLGGRD